ncbi:cullin-3a-like protein, partial [Trifolium pratense]
MHHNMALGFVHGIMLYMDRTFLQTNQGTKTIHEIGLRNWIDFVIGSIGIRNKLPITLVNLVLRERRGEVINTGLTGNIIKMLMDLGMPVYEKNFRKPFLADFEDFYGSESRELINSVDCRDYLMEAERRINEEWERVSDYLDPSCESKIISVVVKQMIENHMQTLVYMENSGLVNMLMDDKFEDLKRMYNLFSRTPSGLTVVKDAMTSFIQVTGEKLIMDPERLKYPEAFAQNLLDFKKKYDNVIAEAFNSDKLFQKVLNSAFEHFINLNAKYVFDLENSGLVPMFNGDKYVDLERMYNLFRSVPYGLVIVKDVMTSSIQYTGKQLIMNPKRLEDPEAFAQRLLDLKDKYEKVITRVFNSEEIFQNVLNSAFGYFINLNAESDFDLENSGLVCMFKGDKYVDLKILYNLFRSVPYGLVIVKDAMTSSIRATGKQLIMDPESLKDPEAFAQFLIDLKGKYDKVIEKAFNSDEIFQNVLNSAFEHVMTSFIRHTGKHLIMDPERLKDPVDLVQRLLDLKDKYDKAITLAFNNDMKFQNALNSAF